MAEKPPSGPPTGEPPMATPPPPKPAPAPVAPSQGNPAFRAMGLPNWRPKLPSRNWMIFLSIVGAWTGTLFYDRNQKKKAQQKWCTLVSHIAHEPLQTNTLPRKVTVYLAAPPGDSLRTTREHFLEYVKPILVAAAMDWDVVEGRREGEVRAGTAERIRRQRRRSGEYAETPEEQDTVFAVEQIRDRLGVQRWTGQKGDIVIGRHTWKEYIRGLHEGWLGPLDAPPPPPAIVAPTPTSTADDASPTAGTATLDSTPATESSDDKPAAEEPPTPPTPPTPPPKPLVQPPHNTPSTYPTSPLPASIPSELAASNPIPFPHILGVINTPTRIYRFLTRRHLADDIGRQTAAIVLASHRPYHHNDNDNNQSLSSFPSDTTSDPSTPPPDTSTTGTGAEKWEQQRLLAPEEQEWTKASRKRVEGEGERVWLDDVVIDPRIGARMRRFEIDAEDEERARRIAKGVAGIPGRRVGEKVGEGEESRES